MKKLSKKLTSVLLAAMILLCSVPLFSGLCFLNMEAEATMYSKGETIQFGSYPQSKVTDINLLSELNSLDVQMSSYGYYISSSPSDFMKYGDVEYNGEKYRKVYFSAYRPYWTKNPSSHNEQKNNGYLTNTAYWFKYEPISWTILDADDGLLFCNNILDSRDFHHVDSYPTWSSSDIRYWLNIDFYNTAFSESEKEALALSSIQTPDHKGTEGGPDTEDNIFLLSYEEVISSDYGFDTSYQAKDTNRRKIGTEYAKCQGLWQHNNIGDWWLRSPGRDSKSAKIVDYDGAVNIYNNVTNTGVTSLGVCPAIRIDFEKLSVKDYEITWIIDGTETKAMYKEGDTIETPETPVKDGYTFVGWDNEIPEKMPANDLEFTALFEKIPEPTTTEPTTTQPTTTIPATQPVTEQKITVEIRKPSQNEINYGDSIILHADIKGNLPKDAEIVWSSDNGNFKIVSASVDGTNCTVTPSSSGNTVFTATVYDAEGNVICSDTQSMTSNAGFFQKIIAFFKKLFGMTKVIPEAIKF